VRLCDFAGCDRKHKGHGFCQGHLVQIRKSKPLTPITPKLAKGEGRDWLCENYQDAIKEKLK